jgi:hypothetical protein
MSAARATEEPFGGRSALGKARAIQDAAWRTKPNEMERLSDHREAGVSACAGISHKDDGGAQALPKAEAALACSNLSLDGRVGHIVKLQELD